MPRGQPRSLGEHATYRASPLSHHSRPGIPVPHPAAQPPGPTQDMKKLLVLGSTGSIGLQTLDLVRRAASGLGVVGLAAGSSWETLRDQILEFKPAFAALADPAAAAQLARVIPPTTKLFAGHEALEELCRAADYNVAVHGVVGAAGLAASAAVLEGGHTLALANKESLVIAGALLMELAREKGATIVPVDSEHAAIHQCLRGESLESVRRVLLTASGGPFLDKPLDELAAVTPDLALRHPNWDMGPRVTVGSATLMNKALEVIELHHLFGLSRERIEVVVHPQSIVHSMVEFVDGSVMAQMGPPDMRLPIHCAIHDPQRAPTNLKGFDVTSFNGLTFREPDLERFPALALGYRCLDEGQDSGAVLNAADEVAVEAFLAGNLAFDRIAPLNEAVLNRRPGNFESLADLLSSDAQARALARADIAAHLAH
ncbi:MAG: 1-deoxy-D-xylulose-5-phosphate reductoisomerase [Planctomycetota bacterium]|nr:1-deoxy-D-xylulose-5-phosphate reductoisomerase [Planctomycetota bacterium]